MYFKNDNESKRLESISAKYPITNSPIPAPIPTNLFLEIFCTANVKYPNTRLTSHPEDIAKKTFDKFTLKVKIIEPVATPNHVATEIMAVCIEKPKAFSKIILHLEIGLASKSSSVPLSSSLPIAPGPNIIPIDAKTIGTNNENNSTFNQPFGDAAAERLPMIASMPLGAFLAKSDIVPFMVSYIPLYIIESKKRPTEVNTVLSLRSAIYLA